MRLQVISNHKAISYFMDEELVSLCWTESACSEHCWETIKRKIITFCTYYVHLFVFLSN